MAEYIQVAGKSNIYMALDPATPSNITKIGEQMDETRIEIVQFLHDVHGDRHGGPQGPPIERQMLGNLARAQFSLSRWDQEARAALHKHGVFATEGAILDSEVGALLLRDRSFRLTIQPSKDNSPGVGQDDPFFYNFPCVTISTPIACGQGTKHSILQFSLEAHRAPEGHPKAGILFDRDDTNIPALV